MAASMAQAARPTSLRRGPDGRETTAWYFLRDSWQRARRDRQGSDRRVLGHHRLPEPPLAPRNERANANARRWSDSPSKRRHAVVAARRREWGVLLLTALGRGARPPGVKPGWPAVRRRRTAPEAQSIASRPGTASPTWKLVERCDRCQEKGRVVMKKIAVSTSRPSRTSTAMYLL